MIVPTIRILPESTINRIAAGEVIERPAAALKELLENALDAGAGRITIALEGGGIERIEVTDDGCGMEPASLKLAVQRHATSKLTDDSLAHITTLGFRGEALPSIGAAARLAITSRPPNADSAATISVDGGKVSEIAPAAGLPGTRVVVEDLFFATPARRKFLKSARTESDHAETVARRLALAAPKVAFRLEIDGRPIFDLPSQDRGARVAALLGPEAAAALLQVETKRGLLRLSGFICTPSITRATGASQTFTVNGRPVADPVLKTAVRVAYRDVIEANRHPVVALWLDLPAEEIDVNVHPAKLELRFRDPGAVRGLVIATLGKALASSVVPAAALLHRPGLTLASSPLPRQIRPWMQLPPAPMGAYTRVAEPLLSLERGPSARVVPAHEPQPEFPLGAPVAQVLNTYVIAVAADGSLILVDQHAAHERLTQETIRDQMLDGGVRSQPLLLPAVIDLAYADVARLLAHAEELERLGLEMEGFGPGAVLVRALPAALGAPEPGPLLQDLADELAEFDETTTLAARLDAVIARLACHGSIRAGRRLNLAEMDSLLRQMEATPRVATCSHGRPTFLRLSRQEIERLFGRR